jgi:hypothetical protein
MILLDLPMLFLFVYEVRKNKITPKGLQNLDSKEKRIAILLYLMIIFTILISADRIVINDIVMRVFFLYRDDGSIA